MPARALQGELQHVKVLTLTQPWASLVILGQKQWETRSWRTNYTGPLVIHAALGFPRWAQDLLQEEEFARVLGNSRLPRGELMGVVNLWCCKPTDEVVRRQGNLEKAFGDWSPGRWAWGLQHPRRAQRPVRAKGSLGLWTLNPKLEGRLLRTLI